MYPEIWTIEVHYRRDLSRHIRHHAVPRAGTQLDLHLLSNWFHNSHKVKVKIIQTLLPYGSQY